MFSLVYNHLNLRTRSIQLLQSATALLDAPKPNTLDPIKLIQTTHFELITIKMVDFNRKVIFIHASVITLKIKLKIK